MTGLRLGGMQVRVTSTATCKTPASIRKKYRGTRKVRMFKSSNHRRASAPAGIRCLTKVNAAWTTPSIRARRRCEPAYCWTPTAYEWDDILFIHPDMWAAIQHEALTRAKNECRVP